MPPPPRAGGHASGAAIGAGDGRAAGAESQGRLRRNPGCGRGGSRRHQVQRRPRPWRCTGRIAMPCPATAPPASARRSPPITKPRTRVRIAEAQLRLRRDARSRPPPPAVPTNRAPPRHGARSTITSRKATRTAVRSTGSSHGAAVHHQRLPGRAWRGAPPARPRGPARHHAVPRAVHRQQRAQLPRTAEQCRRPRRAGPAPAGRIPPGRRSPAAWPRPAHGDRRGGVRRLPRGRPRPGGTSGSCGGPGWRKTGRTPGPACRAGRRPAPRFACDAAFHPDAAGHGPRPAARDVICSRAAAPMEGSASPRKPSVVMRTSWSSASLEVQCRCTASTSACGAHADAVIGDLDAVRCRRAPAPPQSGGRRHRWRSPPAPWRRRQGRSITSPAAIRSTSASGRRRSKGTGSRWRDSDTMAAKSSAAAAAGESRRSGRRSVRTPRAPQPAAPPRWPAHRVAAVRRLVEPPERR